MVLVMVMVMMIISVIAKFLGKLGVLLDVSGGVAAEPDSGEDQ